MSSANDLGQINLIWADTDAPGYSRRRHGRGFSYLQPCGALLRDAQRRKRLKSLGLPPAWERAWYCTDPRGHIQALAYDERERRQYLYHPHWREWRDSVKFARLADFIMALPDIRAAARRALASEDRFEAGLGAVATLMDKGALRVGSERYAQENGAYGASSLRKRHVNADDGTLNISFTAKGGKARKVAIHDKRLARVAARLQDLPGQRLFDIEQEGETRRIDSGAVNRWLARHGGEGVTAKDFRTLAGSAAAFEALADVAPPDGARARNAALSAAYAAAARRLGNTKSVAKASYVHPAIKERWEAGELRRIQGRARRMALKAGLAEKSLLIIAREAAAPP